MYQSSIPLSLLDRLWAGGGGGGRSRGAAAAADWPRAALDGVGADVDVAAEDGAFIDGQLAAREVALVVGRVFQLDAVAGAEIALHGAFNHDPAGVDVGFDLGFLGNVELTGRVDLAFDAALDAHAFVERELALKD